MTGDQIIDQIAQAMAKAVKDPESSHYRNAARAAMWKAKELASEIAALPEPDNGQ
jgi:hypothetical protein